MEPQKNGPTNRSVEDWVGPHIIPNELGLQKFGSYHHFIKKLGKLSKTLHINYSEKQLF